MVYTYNVCALRIKNKLTNSVKSDGASLRPGSEDTNTPMVGETDTPEVMTLIHRRKSTMEHTKKKPQ
jgi:hypothetical protein